MKKEQQFGVTETVFRPIGGGRLASLTTREVRWEGDFKNKTWQKIKQKHIDRKYPRE